MGRGGGEEGRGGGEEGEGRGEEVERREKEGEGTIVYVHVCTCNYTLHVHATKLKKYSYM